MNQLFIKISQYLIFYFWSLCIYQQIRNFQFFDKEKQDICKQFDLRHTERKKNRQRQTLHQKRIEENQINLIIKIYIKSFVFQRVSMMQGKNQNFIQVKNSQILKEYAYKEDQNYPARFSMEDAHFIIDDAFNDGLVGFYGVLDGHGGSEVVESCVQFIPEIFKKEYKKEVPVKELFTQIFKKTDDKLRLVGASDQGACACIALVRKEGLNDMKCYVGNLGDTRAVLCENDKAVRVSTDHKATNDQEIRRIKDMGGMIIRGRVSGSLAVTRALGDLDLKTEGVLNVPDVQDFMITSKTQYLILASDGLWDVVDDQKAIDLCKNMTDTGEMAKKLVKYAIDNGSRDNTSVMILKFN
ncbi:hypothetical protein ABPG72_008354 [Tetrahymena utriculariae]